MGRLRIESDGSISGTRVIDVETDRPIAGVEAVQIVIDAKTREVSATLRLADVEVDLLMEDYNYTAVAIHPGGKDD